MASVGILVHHERPGAWTLASEALEWLLARDHDVRIPHEDAARVAGGAQVATDPDELIAGLDLLIGIGGDGTILRAVEIASDDDVPVLGVNAGQLGYLASVEPGSLLVSIKRFLAGSHDVEERMRLGVRIERGDGAIEDLPTALNEAVVERSDLGHTVQLDVAFDGRYFTPYVADGVILATPTGSTAYAFSVRGPIIAPRHRALLLAPVSPHMLFDRALVLDPTTEVRLTVAGHRSARLSIDGRPGWPLESGDSVICTAARHAARLVTFGHDDFHGVLRDKFGLADRA